MGPTAADVQTDPSASSKSAATPEEEDLNHQHQKKKKKKNRHESVLQGRRRSNAEEKSGDKELGRRSLVQFKEQLEIGYWNYNGEDLEGGGVDDSDQDVEGKIKHNYIGMSTDIING